MASPVGRPQRRDKPSSPRLLTPLVQGSSLIVVIQAYSPFSDLVDDVPQERSKSDAAVADKITIRASEGNRSIPPLFG